MNIVSAYQKYRQKCKDGIFQIQAELIPNNQVLYASMKSDVKTCQSKISDIQKRMTKRTWRLKNLTYLVVNDMNDLKLLLISKKQEQKRNIAYAERFVYKIEQLLSKPVQLLLHIKKITYRRVKNIPDKISFSLNTEINMKDVVNSLGKIQIKETGKRQVRNEELLKVMHKPVFKKSFKVQGVYIEVRQISCVTSDKAWISSVDGYLMLTNTTGEPLHILKNTVRYSGGPTLTSDGHLLYTDRNHSVIKLSKDNKTKRIIKKKRNWQTEYIYCSPFNADILVGMTKFTNNSYAKVIRYNSAGQQLQTIEHNNTGQKLYFFPTYITENLNRDVIVADSKYGIVATELGGEHRFSYTGHPSGSRLLPVGICVDTLSHILVSDAESNTIQMIDKDGRFLSILFNKPQRIIPARGLGYDNRNHLLWVATIDKSRVYIYRYIQRKEFLTDSYESCST